MVDNTIPAQDEDGAARTFLAVTLIGVPTLNVTLAPVLMAALDIPFQHPFSTPLAWVGLLVLVAIGTSLLWSVGLSAELDLRARAFVAVCGGVIGTAFGLLVADALAWALLGAMFAGDPS